MQPDPGHRQCGLPLLEAAAATPWDNFTAKTKEWIAAHCKNGQLLMLGDRRGVYGIRAPLSNIANAMCRGADIQEIPRPDRGEWAYEVKCRITQLPGAPAPAEKQ